MLRRIVDIVAIVAATGIAGAGGWQGYQYMEARSEIKAVSSELRRFEQALSLQSASGQTQTNTRGWPVTIEPEWFSGNPPRNTLVTADRPWLEVAPQDHAHLSHPVIRMTIDRSVPAFWYNPYQGIVRARVPMRISDDRSLQLYNAVNSGSVSSIHGDPVIPAPVSPEDAEQATEEADEGEIAPDPADGGETHGDPAENDEGSTGEPGELEAGGGSERPEAEPKSDGAGSGDGGVRSRASAGESGGK